MLPETLIDPTSMRSNLAEQLSKRLRVLPREGAGRRALGRVVREQRPLCSDRPDLLGLLRQLLWRTAAGCHGNEGQDEDQANARHQSVLSPGAAGFMRPA